MKKLICLMLLICAQLIVSKGFGQSAPAMSLINWILPDVNFAVTVSNIPTNATNKVWSSDCNAVIFVSGQGSNAITIKVPRSSSCSFSAPLTINAIHLKFDYQTPTGQNNALVSQPQLSQGFGVLPFLEAEDGGLVVTTTIFPGESLRAKAKTLPQGGFPAFCTGNSWQITGGSGSPVSNTVWQEDVACSSTGFPNTIQVDLSVGCPSVSQPLTPLTLNVRLRPPVFTAAPTQIGCGAQSPNNIVFSVSLPVGADPNAYMWTFPNNLLQTVGTNVTGSSITFNAIATGVGVVKVTAVAPNGIPVVSSQITSPQFQICCTNLPLNINDQVTSTNSPYLRQSGSTINSTNDITATGTGTMHAQDEVRLLPGFNSILGSQIHVYNDGCTSTFNRSAMSADSNFVYLNDTLGLESQNTYVTLGLQNLKTQIANSETQSSIQKKDLSENGKYNDFGKLLQVIPNPSTGVFTIKLPQSETQPQNISVLNNFGRIIYEIPNERNSETTIDLSEFPGGIYALKVTYADKVLTTKLVKKLDFE
jgi:hypothetical protein